MKKMKTKNEIELMYNDLYKDKKYKKVIANILYNYSKDTIDEIHQEVIMALLLIGVLILLSPNI